jgi:hypothetical protein
MNVGICDYTIMPFVANLAFLQKRKKIIAVLLVEHFSKLQCHMSSS